MKRHIFFFYFLCYQIYIGHTQQIPKKIILGGPVIIDFSKLPDENGPSLLQLSSYSRPGGIITEHKQYVDSINSIKKGVQNYFQSHGAKPNPPGYIIGFSGNATGGTPNDNSISVSNYGKIISAVNSNIRIYNDTGGKQLAIKSLAGVAASLGSLNRSYDPKTIYDPVSDRFILVFLNGVLSTENNIILCFSQTNDPMGKWNCYKLPGTQEGDSSWSDYPIISINQEDLFITVNKLHDGKGWKEGFIKSVIWQVRMKDAYNGDSLVTQYYSNNVYNGKPLWSICPISPGQYPEPSVMYFLSVRPSDISNDSVFLHKIDNTISSGKATISVKLIKADQMYGLPPSAIQPPGNQILETNDCRVLSGIYENGVIQYTQTSIDTSTYNSCIFHGTIYEPDGNSYIKSKLIKNDTLDLAYPSIAYIGEGNTDHGSLITFSYVNPRVYPGTMAVYMNRNLEEYSDFLICKRGEGYINVLMDTAERWGDYTGIHRKYNEKGIVWLSGSWGDAYNAMKTWICKIKNNDPQLLVNTPEFNNSTSVYPVPASETIFIEFETHYSRNAYFNLYTINGTLVKKIYSDYIKPGKYKFDFSVSNIPSGNYIVQIEGVSNTVYSSKITIMH